jgi:hypothetical protein
VVGKMITESDWSKINNLNFEGKFGYNPASDRIPSYVLAYLEEKKTVWSPFPLCYTNSSGKRCFVYDSFELELTEFMKAQQDVWFPHPKASSFIKSNFLSLSVHQGIGNTTSSQHFNCSESFVRYVYRDSILDNLEVGDESENFLSVATYNWFVIMRTFNIMIIGRYDQILKKPERKMLMVYNNISYSSRYQFARIFTIERKEEIKGQIMLIINSWLILKSRNNVPVNDPETNIVNYNRIHTWIYSGPTILEDMVMVFKFYQIWDL